MALPPGFRFSPTDDELVSYYLKRKVAGRSIEFNIITEIDLYKQEPWDLPEKSFLLGSDMEWYFFSPRDKKYPNGLRTNRATLAGYWKATGKDRSVKKLQKVVGMKKTLVFYRGRAPHGERTDYVMHEYRLDEEECEKVHASQDLFVLCRVFKKSGVGPRSGEDRGPQTYVDDDIDKEPSGTFAEAVKRALEPESAPTLVIEAPPAETAQAVEELPPVDTTEDGPIEGLSVDDYAVGEEAGDYPLNMQGEEDFACWDGLSSLDGGMDSLFAAPEGSTGLVPASGYLEGWQVERGMMWCNDLGPVQAPQQFQQEQPSGLSVGHQQELDNLQLELLETDDVLPALVEEHEPSDPLEDLEASASIINSGEDVFQQFRGRTARARSRAARQQQTSEEAQQPARGSNDGLYRSEGAPEQRMSNTNFRCTEVPSHSRGDSAGLNVGGPVPETSSSNYLDANQAMFLRSDYASSVFAAGFDTSGIPAGKDNQCSFHDSLFDFVVDDESINFVTDRDENDLSSATPHEAVGDQGSSDGTVPTEPDKSVKGAVPEGPPRFSALPQGEPSEEKKPLSKPLAGLMRLLGSLPAQPASAAECPPDMKPLLASAEVGSTYSSIHVSAVTVTCTSSADGAQKVETAVTDCRLEGDGRGVYQQVVSGAWKTIPVEKGAPVCANCDTAAANGVLQRRVVRGSNSGFVFVFVLGAVSALCWFLFLRAMWRLASHVVTSVF